MATFSAIYANVRFRLRRSNSVFLQPQFEAFYTVNLLNAKWKSNRNGRADDLIYFCFCEKYQNNWINYIGSKL